MSYTMYLDGVQMPITPSKLQMKIKGKNKTITLVNDGEVNFLKQPGLTEITVPLRLPMLQAYGGGRPNPPDQYLSLFERIITSRAPTRFILSRVSPDGRQLYDTNLKVSLESYSMDEDAKTGPDVLVSLTMKQYKDFGTKTIQIVQATTQPAVVVEAQREASGAPKAQTYTVTSGDCLWNIARRYYGNGADYARLFEANRDKISNPNLIYPGQVLTIP